MNYFAKTNINYYRFSAEIIGDATFKSSISELAARLQRIKFKIDITVPVVS
jgi:hypothetical protein